MYRRISKRDITLEPFGWASYKLDDLKTVGEV